MWPTGLCRDAMMRTEMHARLVSAELSYAHFNALRTAAVEGVSGIYRGSHTSIEYLLDPTRPSSTYYNRAIGRSAASLSGPALRSLPPGVVGLEVTPVQLTHEIAGLLFENAFQPAYQLCYLGAVPAGEMPVKREVIRLGASDVDHFLDLLRLQGVDFSPEKRIRKRRFYCTEQFRAYVLKAADGAACGWATMYVNGNTAFFGNSFTLPRFRRTGAHSALLAARLNDAARTGLEVAFTDVEHNSPSHRNCARAGFRTVTINTIWKRQVYGYEDHCRPADARALA